jgi:hypothetical protein
LGSPVFHAYQRAYSTRANGDASYAAELIGYAEILSQGDLR